MRVAHNSKLKIQNSQFHILPPRHTPLNPHIQLLKHLCRIVYHSQHVAFAHDDAAVLQDKGSVARADVSAIGQGGECELQLLVALQFYGVAARRQKVLRMLQSVAYLALVDYQGALNAILRIVVSYNFYSHNNVCFEITTVSSDTSVSTQLLPRHFA